jgi:hypothetical protein
MSAAAAQASAFYKEVADTGIVWATRDERRYLAPEGLPGQRAMPFCLGRAARVPLSSAWLPIGSSPPSRFPGKSSVPAGFLASQRMGCLLASTGAVKGLRATTWLQWMCCATLTRWLACVQDPSVIQRNVRFVRSPSFEDIP